MPIKALPDTVFFQNIQNLLAGVSLVPGRIVEKHQLLPVPCRFQRRLQAHQLPAEHLFIVGTGLFLLEKPAAGAADGIVLIEIAVIIQQIHLGEFVFPAKFLEFRSRAPPIIVISL